jgi:hypothetical protein
MILPLFTCKFSSLFLHAFAPFLLARFERLVFAPLSNIKNSKALV